MGEVKQYRYIQICTVCFAMQPYVILIRLTFKTIYLSFVTLIKWFTYISIMHTFRELIISWFIVPFHGVCCTLYVTSCYYLFKQREEGKWLVVKHNRIYDYLLNRLFGVIHWSFCLEGIFPFQPLALIVIILHTFRYYILALYMYTYLSISVHCIISYRLIRNIW